MTIADVIAAFAAAASARNRHLLAQARLERACDRRQAVRALVLAPLVVMLRNRADRLEATAERMLVAGLKQQWREQGIGRAATATSTGAGPLPPASAPDAGAARRA